MGVGEPTAKPLEVRPKLIPLVDGTVLASFAIETGTIRYNNSRPRPGPCSDWWLYIDDNDRTHYQTLTYEHVHHPTVAVPGKGALATVTDNVERRIGVTGKRC